MGVFDSTHSPALLKALFSVREEKAVELQFTVGEALSCVAAGPLSTALHSQWDLASRPRSVTGCLLVYVSVVIFWLFSTTSHVWKGLDFCSIYSRFAVACYYNEATDVIVQKWQLHSFSAISPVGSMWSLTLVSTCTFNFKFKYMPTTHSFIHWENTWNWKTPGCRIEKNLAVLLCSYYLSVNHLFSLFLSDLRPQVLIQSNWHRLWMPYWVTTPLIPSPQSVRVPASGSSV